MTQAALKKALHRKIDAAKFADYVIKQPSLLSVLYDGIQDKPASVKFQSVKVLSLISQKKPGLIYPQFDFFVKLLSLDNNIIKWNVVVIIANLTTVDKKKKFEKIFRQYYDLMKENVLVTAALIAFNSGTIIIAKPILRQRIISELLKAEQYKLPTKECRNVLAWRTIQCFTECADVVSKNKRVVAYIKKHLSNRRPSTKKAAEQFFQKI